MAPKVWLVIYRLFIVSCRWQQPCSLNKRLLQDKKKLIFAVRTKAFVTPKCLLNHAYAHCILTHSIFILLILLLLSALQEFLPPSKLHVTYPDPELCLNPFV